MLSSTTDASTETPLVPVPDRIETSATEMPLAHLSQREKATAWAWAPALAQGVRLARRAGPCSTPREEPTTQLCAAVPFLTDRHRPAPVSRQRYSKQGQHRASAYAAVTLRALESPSCSRHTSSECWHSNTDLWPNCAPCFGKQKKNPHLLLC